METTESNQLIALFMGEKIDLDQFGENWKRVLKLYIPNEYPNYHTSWDWLMPVVEKICNEDECYCERFDIGIGDVTVTGYRDVGDDIRIEIPFHHKRFFSHLDLKTTKLQAVYQAVVQFIQWYNKTNKP